MKQCKYCFELNDDSMEFCDSNCEAAYKEHIKEPRMYRAYLNSGRNDNAFFESELKEIKNYEAILPPASPVAERDEKTSLVWVKASERLPIDFEDVLTVHLEAGGVVTGYYDSERGEWTETNATSINEELLVTHWMPLPTPPGETPSEPDSIRVKGEKEEFSDRCRFCGTPVAKGFNICMGCHNETK